MAQGFPAQPHILSSDTMRPLFTSEKRCVLNLFRAKWGRELLDMPTVVSETIAHAADAARTPWFNCDFILDFVDYRAFRSERSAAVCSVLPNALGAELFLIVEKATLVPTALELNGGGAFPIGHFAEYIHVVEATVHKALTSLRTDVPQIRWPEAISIRKAASARVLVVGSDITFLYFTEDTTPAMRGQRVNLVERDDKEIRCYTDGDKVVCFDGWITTEVRVSERVLVSLPKHVL
jgi:hypothetical protein